MGYKHLYKGMRAKKWALQKGAFAVSLRLPKLVRTQYYIGDRPYRPLHYRPPLIPTIPAVTQQCPLPHLIHSLPLSAKNNDSMPMCIIVDVSLPLLLDITQSNTKLKAPNLGL